MYQLDLWQQHADDVIARFKATGSSGDGGKDIRGTCVDVKASLFEKDKSGEDKFYKYFYVSEKNKEYLPWKTYVKAFFRKEYLVNFDKFGRVYCYLMGWVPGTAFHKIPMDPLGNPSNSCNLREMNPMATFDVDKFKPQSMKIDYLNKLNISDTQELFTFFGKK